VPDRVLIAQIGAAHGVRGEVRLKPFTADPLSVTRYGALEAEDGRRFEIETARPAKDMLVVRLKGVTDRSAAEALTNLQIFKPDVLLSDIGLPIESGYELIRKVRSLSSEASQIPAVALTAFATEEDRRLALAAGFQAHLTKPVEPIVLVETIERLAKPQSDSDKP